MSVITGSNVYVPLSERYHRPFVVTGFEAEHILASIYRIVRQIEAGEGRTENLYRSAVKAEGNQKAIAVTDRVFETGPAMWRGLGVIEGSGLYLRGEYAEYDGGSRDLYEDMELPEGCRCGDVIVGRINPISVRCSVKAARDGAVRTVHGIVRGSMRHLVQERALGQYYRRRRR